MKIILATAGLLLLTLSAYAQDTDRPQLRLKRLKNKLEFSHMSKEAAKGKFNLNQQPGYRYSLFPKHLPKNADTAKANLLRSQMPILTPDSAVYFPLLTMKPDPSIVFPMPVIKP